MSDDGALDDSTEARRSEAPVSRAAPPPADAARPRRTLRRIWFYCRIVLVLGAVVAACYFAAPIVMVRRAGVTATECLARFDKPRGPRLPDCSAGIPELSRVARYSWVHHDATYRAEELWARIMIAEYENASIGSPDPGLRAQTAKFVDDAETVVGKGSQRIQLDDLGPVVAAPHLGKLATSLGDRTTLMEHADWWVLWPQRVHAIQAALIEGDLQKAGEIVRRYLDWDPRDPDLRTMMGAVLCLGPDPGRGLDLLSRVPVDRADKRYAAIARNYGEVLAVMEACAKKAGVDSPTPPSVTHAGIADIEEARLVEEIRLAKLPALIHQSSDQAVTLLQEERGFDNDQPGTRAMLLAAVVAYDDRVGDERGPLSSAIVANLATPREHEPRLAPSLRLTPRDLLNEAPGVRPILGAEALAKASARLEKLAAIAKPMPPEPKPAHPKDGDAGDAEPKLVVADPAAALLNASGAVAMYAALAAARVGDVESALRDVDTAARLAHVPDRTKGLAGATVAYVAGDAKRALDRLAGAEGDDSATEADCAVVAALAHASLNQKDAARKDVVRALELGAKANDPRTDLDARWLDLALGEAPPVTSPLAPPVWMGMADPLARWETLGRSPIDANLAAWRAAMGASDEDRLAFRYAVIRMRGDSPDLAVAYLVAGGRLDREGASNASIEVWLDALSTDDATRMPISAYVWSREEAARIRGDNETADVWKKRLLTIRAMKSSDPDLEIARFLGL